MVVAVVVVAMAVVMASVLTELCCVSRVLGVILRRMYVFALRFAASF